MTSTGSSGGETPSRWTHTLTFCMCMLGEPSENCFSSSNFWLSVLDLGANGFAMVLESGNIEPKMVFQWFPMVANHSSNEEMVILLAKVENQLSTGKLHIIKRWAFLAQAEFQHIFNQMNVVWSFFFKLIQFIFLNLIQFIRRKKLSFSKSRKVWSAQCFQLFFYTNIH